MAIDTSIISHKVQLGFVFPLQLGNVTGFGPDTIYSSGNDVEVNTGTNTYDAFGTVTLPNGAFPALRVSGTTVTKSYLSGTLANTNTSYTISWLTESGNQLEVQVDSPSSGSVKVHSVSLINIGTTSGNTRQSADSVAGEFYAQPELS